MKPILLIGSAECGNLDVKMARSLLKEYDVMAVGLDCSYADDIKYFVTYHYKDIPEYIRRRKMVNSNLDFLVISHLSKPGVDIIEPHRSPTGSSALLGAAAALKLGYKKIILCGCPLIGRSKKDGYAYSTFQKGWEKRINEVRGFVKSFSGWTKEFLGEPTKDWIMN